MLLSAIFQRTRHLRAGALTFCLPWHDPYRFYHEVCMLDQLSRRPPRARRRARRVADRVEDLRHEQHRGVARALSGGPRGVLSGLRQPALNFDGKLFHYRDAELHVKPLQKPYPPLWFPSSNRESIEFTARHGYHTAFLGKLADCKPHFERYREVWQRHRDDPGRHNAHVSAPFLAKTQHLVIADTDAEAEKLGLEAYSTFVSHIHHLTRKAGRPEVHKTTPYDEDSWQRLIVGSPRSALEKVQEMLRVTGANYLLCIFSFGSLAPRAALRSLELFAREVMPKLRA